MKKIWVAFCGIMLIVVFAYAYQDIWGTPLSEGVLRLHVIANSDNLNDQQLKLELKDEVVKQMSKNLTRAPDAKTARQIAIHEIPALKEHLSASATEQGYDYPINIEVGEYDFPTKSYGNLVFPGGEYQALRVIIGAGQGKNWWCVLFPPLCMVSSSEEGLSLNNPQKAKVSLKCLKYLPQGLRVTLSGKEHDG